MTNHLMDRRWGGNRNSKTMKKLIIALVCLFASVGARAQLVAVSGNVKDVGATNATGSNTYVRFSLINFGPAIPRVIGTNVIANPVKDFHPNSLGNISGTLQGNDTITPVGTDYQVCILYQGNQFRCATYNIIGPTFNLNTAIPITSPPPSNQLVYGAKTYVFTQTTPSLTWVIPHHFGDKNVQVQCRDLTDHVLFPDTIVLTDNNTVTVNFIIPQAGTCIVISGGSATFTSVIGDAVIKNPNAAQTVNGQDLNIQGHLTALGSFTATAGQNLINAYGFNGDCYVDGIVYPRTSAGINAAIASCSPGRTHIPAGGYSNLTDSIVTACGQSLVFDGNPTLVFSLTGTDPAFIYNSAQCGSYINAITGGFVVDMQHTGGTVFKLCVGTAIGGVFGPSDGTIDIMRQQGNTMDVGPCGFNYSVGNFTVQNITSQTVPGDLINIITNNNYSGTQQPSPYIEAVTFSHIAALDVTGRMIRINANTTGPELNINGLSFDHIFATNSTNAANPPSPIFIQSSLTTLNSISFQVRDSALAFPFATGTVTIVDSDGGANTTGSLLGVVIDNVDIQGGTNPAVGFSSTILANASGAADLQYRGGPNATSYRTMFSSAFGSTTANPATVGTIRLSGTDAVCWRNNANSSDLCLTKTSGDQFGMPGAVLAPSLIGPTIGGGSTINNVYRASGLSLNSAFTAIAAQTCQEQTITLTGAATTGVASVSPSTGLGSTNLSWSAWVSSANTITVRVCNPTVGALTPSSVTWSAIVTQ